jgi:hypothetical protein
MQTIRVVDRAAHLGIAGELKIARSGTNKRAIQVMPVAGIGWPGERFIARVKLVALVVESVYKS